MVEPKSSRIRVENFLMLAPFQFFLKVPLLKAFFWESLPPPMVSRRISFFFCGGVLFNFSL